MFSTSFPKLILSLVYFLLIGVFLVPSTFAQSTSVKSECVRFGLSDVPKQLAASLAKKKWIFSADVNDVKHEFYIRLLNPKGRQSQTGISMTRYYASNLKRTRYISQILRVCYIKADGGYVLLFFGSYPMDVDTRLKGSNLGYVADSFVLTLNDDVLVVTTEDASRQQSRIDSKETEAFPKDIQDKLFRLMIENYDKKAR